MRGLRLVVGDPSVGFKPLALAAIGGILVSRIHNFLSNSGLSFDYHAWFGIQQLPAQHVVAVAIFYPGPKPSLKGVAIPGAIFVAISGAPGRIVLS